MSSLRILLFVGFPCGGKSTIAQAVASFLGFSFLCKDTIQGTCIDSGISFRAASVLAYNLLARMTKDELSVGNSVVIDSSCSKPAHRQSIINVAGDFGAQFHMFECRCDSDEILKQRFTERGKTALTWRVNSWEDYQSVLAKYVPYTEPRLVVDSTRPLEVSVRLITQLLSKESDRRLSCENDFGLY